MVARKVPTIQMNGPVSQSRAWQGPRRARGILTNILTSGLALPEVVLCRRPARHLSATQTRPISSYANSANLDPESEVAKSPLEFGNRCQSCVPRLLQHLERRRPRHPHPERSQGGVREVAVRIGFRLVRERLLQPRNHIQLVQIAGKAVHICVEIGGRANIADRLGTRGIGRGDLSYKIALATRNRNPVQLGP